MIKLLMSLLLFISLDASAQRYISKEQIFTEDINLPFLIQKVKIPLLIDLNLSDSIVKIYTDKDTMTLKIELLNKPLIPDVVAYSITTKGKKGLFMLRRGSGFVQEMAIGLNGSLLTLITTRLDKSL